MYAYRSTLGGAWQQEEKRRPVTSWQRGGPVVGETIVVEDGSWSCGCWRFAPQVPAAARAMDSIA